LETFGKAARRNDVKLTAAPLAVSPFFASFERLPGASERIGKVDSMATRSLTADRIGWNFAQLLKWHLTRGTRPKGTLDLPGEQWTNARFGAAVGAHERTVRNWLRGKNAPVVITAIEQKLFGDNIIYAGWRTELREAHRLAQDRQEIEEQPQQLEAAPLAVFKDIDAIWCPELVALLAGEFLMGSLEGEYGRFDDERPQHPIAIDNRLAIGRYPVTFDEYDHFCAATRRQKPNDEGWGRGRRPVIHVSWEDAQAYVNWLSSVTGSSYRLPTEAEWEFACRAGTTTPFSFGDRIAPSDANYSSCKIAQTCDVGSYPPNDWGLFDMHGNVWEWCWDGKREYRAARAVDPVGSTDVLAYRVTRGGSWSVGVRYLRSAFRHSDAPGYRADDVGFRCARLFE
jgi:formylglycine-generating enzyme required for sulfatase activity